MVKSNYSKVNRLADVVGAIQFMAMFRWAPLKIETCNEELPMPLSADLWEDVFLEHPEFFRITKKKGVDLHLLSSLNDVSRIPTEGKNLIIVAAVNNVLHFRIFDSDGKVAVDTDEKRLTEQARQIEDLRKQLESLWPPHELTRSDKDRVITAVTSIVGHTLERQGEKITHVSLHLRHALDFYDFDEKKAYTKLEYDKLGKEGFDLRLMYSESDVSSIPTSGTNLVIVADVKGVLHFRIFDSDGKVVVDTDETRLTTQSGPIADLKRQLDSVRPPHELTRSEKDRGVTAVTSIVGHTRKEKKPMSRRRLTSDQLAALLKLAVDLHAQAISLGQEKRWLIPLLVTILVAVIGLSGTILTVLLRSK